MKRLWISLFILALLLCVTLAHTFYMSHVTTQMNQYLAEAESCANQEDWEGAQRYSNQAQTLWDAHDGYFHITLRHCDTDQITESFQSVSQLMDCQDYTQYTAINARLQTQIHLLWEDESLSLKNIL